jgi:hypothetical protein
MGIAHKVPTLPPGWVVDTADWHAHMQGPKAKFTGCEQPGVTKSDTVTGQAGPSDQDVRGDAEFYRRYGYVIEGPRGDIYGYNNPPRPPPPDATPSSPIRRWQRDGESACYVRKP